MKGPIGCLPRYVWIPNIVGSFSPRLGSAFAQNVTKTGAFKTAEKAFDQIATGNGLSGDGYLMGFDASSADATYAGTTVQTSALSTLACIKF